MSGGTFRLSRRQLVVLGFALSLCVTPFGFPGIIDRQLGRQGWLATLPGIAIGLAGMLVAVSLGRRFPTRPLDRVAQDLLGTLPGLAYCVALAALFAGGAAVNLRIFAQVSTATELTHLSPIYPAALTGAVGTLAAYYGPEAVARTGEALAALIAPGLLLIFAPLLFKSQFGALQPIGHAAWASFTAPDVLAVGGAIRGFLPVLVLAPFCRPRPRAAPLCAAAVAAGLLVAASFAVPVMLFGARFTAQLRYPLLVAVGTLVWQWLPLHHMVVLTMLVWHAVVLIVFAAYLWLGAWLVQRLLPRAPWALILLGMAVAEIAGASLELPGNVSQAVVTMWNEAVVVLGVAVPGLLVLLARLRLPAARRRAAGVG